MRGGREEGEKEICVAICLYLFVSSVCFVVYFAILLIFQMRFCDNCSRCIFFCLRVGASVFLCEFNAVEIMSEAFGMLS